MTREQASKDSIELIREFSEIDGIPGFESEVASLFGEYMKKYGADVDRDYMGNVTGTLAGGKKKPRIMLTAHMDEIGMVVQSINDDGLLNFIVHGSWWYRLMLQQPVTVKTGSGPIPGIISSTSSYFRGNELERFESKRSMYIDVGASSRRQAMDKLGIQPGDPISLDSKFRQMSNPELYTGKAFDDRIGLAAIIDTIRKLSETDHPNTIIATATVQEEVGGRGAAAAAEFCNPDIALVIEGPPADDIPLEKNISQCILGNGAHIRRLEPGMIGNAGLHRFVLKTAREMKIRFQEAVSPIGGTDGAVIHKSRFGIPALMLGVPVRYAHAHHGMFNIGDYTEIVHLLVEVLKRLDSSVMEMVRDNPYG